MWLGWVLVAVCIFWCVMFILNNCISIHMFLCKAYEFMYTRSSVHVYLVHSTYVCMCICVYVCVLSILNCISILQGLRIHVDTFIIVCMRVCACVCVCVCVF